MSTMRPARSQLFELRRLEMDATGGHRSVASASAVMYWRLPSSPLTEWPFAFELVESFGRGSPVAVRKRI
jgi:hypothetical protein